VTGVTGRGNWYHCSRLLCGSRLKILWAGIRAETRYLSALGSSNGAQIVGGAQWTTAIVSRVSLAAVEKSAEGGNPRCRCRGARSAWKRPVQALLALPASRDADSALARRWTECRIRICRTGEEKQPRSFLRIPSPQSIRPEPVGREMASSISAGPETGRLQHFGKCCRPQRHREVGANTRKRRP
jgi:hypothetical protein